MIGLVRQHFRKHSDLSVLTADTLKAISRKLNDRPRKCLIWQSPAQLFPTELKFHPRPNVPITA